MAGVYVMRYHVILRDELGDEFSVEVEALDQDAAWEAIDNSYPESFVVSFRELRTRTGGN